MPAIDVVDEFETIDRLLKPLAHPEWARGLMDDVAVLPQRPGFDLVLTKDAVVEGVHFLPDDPLDTVAQKLLRTNLSDLAAKAAEPFGYLLMCAWSPRCGWPEREAFAAGLAADQAAFGVRLLGGDTVRTPGPATFSATLLGWAPRGRVIGRAGAGAGDQVFVTGAIGDGVLGLMAARCELNLQDDRLQALADRYRRPTPRLDAAPLLRDFATASADVSDGLVADLGHVARASGLQAELDLEVLPLSAAASAWMEGRVDAEAALIDLATGGDDYQIVFTAPPHSEAALRAQADRLRVRLTRVGRMAPGSGVRVQHHGRAVQVAVPGYVHG